jgi:hypothetical protein
VLFTVGPDGDVDGADRPRGVSVIAADLGPSAPEGLIVVLDAMDEPQSVVEVDGNLVNRSWNVKLAPWTSALLTPAPWDTPASPATPVASPTPGATESRTSTLFIPAAAQSG